MYEQTERRMDGMTTVGNVRMSSRQVEATEIADTHKRNSYDQAFMW